MTTPFYTDFTGLAGIALALGSLALLFPGVPRLRVAQRAGLFAAVIVVVVLPLGTLPLVGCVRGGIGELSLTSLVLVVGAIFRGFTGRALFDPRARFALLAGIAITAVSFYPMALGVGLFDPYRLGYGSPWFWGGLVIAALGGWWLRWYAISICLALATLGWSVRWYESTNLWDYLLDPLVSFYALGTMAIWGGKRALSVFLGRRTGSAPAQTTVAT